MPGFTRVEDSVKVGPVTVTALLLTLSGPRQFMASTGVTEYTHRPAGTLASAQPVAVTVPPQPDPMA
jgi:hypothetical protein